MYTIKTIIAHPNQFQLRIMIEMMKHQSIQMEIVGKVMDLDDLYESIIRHAPDLIILPDGFFTPCINAITANSDVICITEDRSLSDNGNILYAYVPVQPPELINMVQSIYQKDDEGHLQENYQRRRTFFGTFRFPPTYCAAIDKFCQENQINNAGGYSPFAQKQIVFEQIRSGSLRLEQVKEHHPGVAFNAEKTFDPIAMQLVDNLGEIAEESDYQYQIPRDSIPDSFSPEVNQAMKEQEMREIRESWI